MDFTLSDSNDNQGIYTCFHFINLKTPVENYLFTVKIIWRQIMAKLYFSYGNDMNILLLHKYLTVLKFNFFINFVQCTKNIWYIF